MKFVRNWGRLGMKFDEYRFDEITLNYDKERIPLSAMERGKRQGKYRYYGAQGIIDYVNDYIFDGKYLLIAEDGENLKSKKQNIAQIVEGQFWVNNHAHIVKCNEKCILEYLAYIMNCKDISGYITGSAQPKLSQANLKAMTFNIPPVAYQKKCLNVLLPIEHKIKLNTTINNNLLEQALTLYATQFSSLELNGCIGDYCAVKSGFAFKSSWWTNSGIRVIKIGSINQDNLNLLECSYVDEDKADKAKDFVVKAGDLLIAMTGATIGKFAMVPYSSEMLLVNQRVGKFFLGNNPVEKLPFIYCTLKQPEVYGEVVNRGQGSAQPNISASDIMSIPCVIPSKDAINDFNNTSQPLFDLIISNQRENQHLSELRNALLPKLMSGELDVSNIEI